MIEYYKTSIDPFCIPHSEQYNLSALSKVEDGKVHAMKFIGSTRLVNKVHVTQHEKIEATIENIAEVVVDYFNITMEDLKGKCREGDIMKARNIYCAVARNKTECTLGKISAFVNRAHCTVIWACKSVDQIGKYKNDTKSQQEHYAIIKERFI